MLTGLIYDTIQEPRRWLDALEAMAGTLDAKSGLLRTLDLRGRHAVLASHTYNLDRSFQDDYQASLVEEDPYVHALKRMPAGRIVNNEHLVNLGRLCRTRYYRDYLAPLGNHFIVGGFVERNEDGRYTIMGLQRHRGSRQFDAHEIEAVQQLVPHMYRAVQFGRMLRHERRRSATAESALDALSVAALLLDRQGTLVHSNSQGDRLLRGEHGLRLKKGKLAAQTREQTDALADLVTRARHAADGKALPSVASLLLHDPTGNGPNLLAVVAPLRRPDGECELGEEWPDAAIAVYAGDLDDTGLMKPDILRHMYGLTDAEARLAVAIGRGRELPELSDCWQVSVETLRSHLKSVFAKMDVNRQTDLVRLLAGTPWKLASPVEPESPHYHV